MSEMLLFYAMLFPIKLRVLSRAGLDSSNALKVVALLKGLTRAGHTVICSLHSPR